MEERGFTFKLAIDCTEPEKVTPEDEALLAKLAANRDDAIWALFARMLAESGPKCGAPGKLQICWGAKELPFPVPMPARWEIQAYALGIMEAAVSDNIAQFWQYIRDAAYMIHLWAEGEDKAKAAIPAFEKAHGKRLIVGGNV